MIRGVLFGAGLLLLYLGAEGLVRGASRLARSMGVSALVVGLTVVAFGTSAPELVVGVVAAVAGRPDIVVGNVVGSNVANIALILGLAAIMCPIAVQSRLVRGEIPLMIVVSAGLIGLVLDGVIGRADAALCLLGFGAYLLFVLRFVREAPPEREAEYEAFEAAVGAGGEGAEPRSSDAGAGGRGRDAGLVVLGLATLVLGAHLLVESSVWFARQLGVPELIVGLTLVAVGTSLPELATSMVAALRRQADIAVGNIVGSNIFNILAILGVAGLIRPLGSDPSLIRFELPVMVGVALLLLPLAWTRFEIQRWEGVVLLAGYAVFLWIVVGRALAPA